MKILLIDPLASGVSGDMLVSALVDMGADPKPLHRLAQTIPSCIDGVERISIAIERTVRAGIASTHVHIHVEEHAGEREPQELLSALDRLRAKLGLSEYVYGKARKALVSLWEAEKKVHGAQGQGHLHLHELGSADTVFDAVAFPLLLEKAGLSRHKIISLPVAAGRGTIKIRHGLVSVPAPATLELLKAAHIPYILGPADGELATPTGVALLAAVAESFTLETPPLRVTRSGYGAGDKDYGTQPLRVLELEAEDAYEHDTVVVLETNLDDVDGELLGYTGNLLRENGALDVYVFPAIAKKSRPGLQVQVIARAEDAEKLASLMFRELGTLGIRFYEAKRIKLPRKTSTITLNIDGTPENVRVKTALLDGKPVNIKPEHDDLEAIARKHGISLKKLRRLVEKTLLLGEQKEGSRNRP